MELLWVYHGYRNTKTGLLVHSQGFEPKPTTPKVFPYLMGEVHPDNIQLTKGWCSWLFPLILPSCTAYNIRCSAKAKPEFLAPLHSSGGKDTHISCNKHGPFLCLERLGHSMHIPYVFI